MCYRAHYANIGLAHNGQKTGLYFGIGQTLVFLRNAYPNCKFYWCWDGPIEKLWRRDIEPNYKQHRIEGTTNSTDDARTATNASKSTLAKMLASLGIPWLECPFLEADDILSIGTMITDSNVVLATTDMDAYQLVKDSSHQPTGNRWVVAHHKHPVNEAYIYGKWGVASKDWLFYRALTGDTSDKISGLSGCGDKNAKLMLDYDVRPDLPWEQQNHGFRTKFAKFAAAWPSANKSYSLMKLPQDVTHFPKQYQGPVLEFINASFVKEKYIEPIESRERKWVQYCEVFGLLSLVNRFPDLALH